MSGKEKAEKENEQFSSSILYVATSVYVGFCAMVFGALCAKMPTFGEAFLDLMKNYGTILAGIPVLVAVVVAKQQLDANRRQHVATIKLQFRLELDALNKLEAFAEDLNTTSYSTYAIVASLSGYEGIYIGRPSSIDVEKYREFLPSGVMYYCSLSIEQITLAINASKGVPYPSHKSLDHIEEAKKYATAMLEAIEHERARLSQYWS
ncbi:hypothetical protein IPU75_12035 [Ochrobactrum sp. SD129]|nr:hypothetical protein [Ochrobactrum sp. SD129]